MLKTSVLKHFLHYQCLFFNQPTTSMPRNSKTRFHRSTSRVCHSLRQSLRHRRRHRYKNPADYRLNAYDKATDLYIFNENVNFHEGLEQVFRILLEQSFKDFEPSKIEPVIDVGIPPIETLREVFDSVVKHFLPPM